MNLNSRLSPSASARLRTIGPALAAFALVTIGTLIALPNDDSADANDKVPTVVATATMSSGTDTSDVRTKVEIRDLDPSARAQGALTSIDEIPDGVIAIGLVPGQQLLESSFASTSVAALGPDYVAVSVRLDPQQWVGPVIIAGNVVDVYDVFNEVTTLVAHEAVILDAPAADGLAPQDETIVSLGVRKESLPAVLVAATNNRIWLTGV